MDLLKDVLALGVLGLIIVGSLRKARRERLAESQGDGA